MRELARGHSPRALPRYGFTLPELLVVIGIIVVLTALLLSGVAAVRREARALQCRSNMRQLATGLIAYAGVSKGHFPPNTGALGHFWHDVDRIGQFVPVPGSIHLPDDNVFGCPDDDWGRRSYAMNIWASAKMDSLILSPPAKGTRWKLGVPQSPRMILLVEAWSYFGGVSPGYTAAPFVGASLTAGKRLGGAGGLPAFSAVRWGKVNCEITYARHRRSNAAGIGTQPRGRTVIAFADGHVELLANDELVDYETGALTGNAYWSPLDVKSN